MNRVHANGISLSVAEIDPAGQVHAEPPTVVLIHGLAGDSMASWYLSLAYPLAQAGLRVLLYDLRGHGHSERPAHGYAFDDFVDDLDALLAQRDSTGRVHLIGNSFGGTIAFGYAARHPDRVASIVAIDSAPPSPDWFARIAGRFRQAAAFSAPRDHKTFFARRLRDVQQFLAETSAGEELPASRLPDPAAFTAVTCPVLCLYGGGSLVHELAAQTQRLLPQTRTVVLPDAKHTMLIDQSAEVGGHVLPWLRDAEPSPAFSTEGNSHG